MKTNKLFLLMAGFAFASCSSEAPVEPVNTGNSTEEALLLDMRVPNLSRAGGLEKYHADFGVWGYKSPFTDGSLQTTGREVMNNYLVGHNSKYTPGADQELYGSNWFYENLGNSQDISTTSNKAEQWLKYWDMSQNSYFFYAYAPYINGNAETCTFDPATRTLVFNTPLTLADASEAYSNLMYSAAYVKKEAFKQDVAMEFKRFNAQIEIAYYNAIPGYDVEILSGYNFSGTGADVTAVKAAAVNGGQYATVGWAVTPGNPTQIDLPDGTTYASYDGYTKNSYLWQAKPSVRYGKVDNILTFGASENKLNVSWRDVKTTSISAGWKAPEITADANGHKFISIEKTAPSFSPTVYNVIPCATIDAANGTTYATGYRLFVNYKLVAKDTNEEIIVYNAPVFIPAEYAQWESNKHYTYVFKFTKSSGGTTDTPDNPDPDDPDTPALYPIVFNNLTVANYADPTKAEVFDISTGHSETIVVTNAPVHN